jgi:hypothetical protein
VIGTTPSGQIGNILITVALFDQGLKSLYGIKSKLTRLAHYDFCLDRGR